MRSLRLTSLIFLALAFCFPGALLPAYAQTAPKPRRWEWVRLNQEARISYSRRGLLIETPAKNYTTNIRWRLQPRFSTPFDKPPQRPAQFGVAEKSALHLNRARLKVGGHAPRPWVQYYLEHDLIHNQLLELYLHVERYPWLQVRFGQWKAEFGRSRSMSSGNLQFVDRSIISPFTTIERQPGIQLRGRLKPGTHADSRYFVGVFGGNGPGQGFTDGDGHPLYLARYQWNLLGSDLPFSASDIERHERPAASLAVAALTNRSRYTRFSGSGGSALEGFEIGAPGQFMIKQAMAEFALKYGGLSIQNENHWKRVTNTSNGVDRDLRGSYVQAGYFMNGIVSFIPKNLETAYRFALVDPASGRSHDLMREHSVALNYFFEGHVNKLTFDVSRISMAAVGSPERTAVRYRLQWDVHF